MAKKLFSYRGEEYTIEQLARMAGVHPRTMYNRLVVQGHPPEQCVVKRMDYTPRMIDPDHCIYLQKVWTLDALVEAHGGGGVSRSIFEHRYYDKLWSFTDSLLTPKNATRHSVREARKKARKELNRKLELIRQLQSEY